MIPADRCFADSGQILDKRDPDMWGQHLKRRGSWWHYCWVVPKAFHDVGRRRLISFSLKTQDFAQTKLQAAQVSLDLDCESRRALARGRSLNSVDAVERFRASAETQTACGFAPKEWSCPAFVDSFSVTEFVSEHLALVRVR